ncbi:hypothetical protein [Butyrivibrio sp. AE2015]|uniref:hypothetical protein n=1 Tax=Butyrivibrio sp. AE2015 TaxID=1280663 RepID=UPI0003B78704|nr:hypothetical protein [Butyrivibrio sp. AE2015]
MRGSHHIIVSNSTVKYEFDIKRNITIIKGNSATGKTTLVEMINEHYESGDESGVTVSCDKECRVVAGREWKLLLSNINDSIVFIDEDNDFLPSVEFAEAVKCSDNYYVIVTREGLSNLPYSVDEIYGIKSSGKFSSLKQVYHEFYHIYGDNPPIMDSHPETVIVEDSNSGYEFFNGVSEGKDYKVISAKGKSNIFKEIIAHRGEKILVIADGAAFGSEVDRVMKLVSGNNRIILLLPESFEWLVLSSNVFSKKINSDILNHTSEYVESAEFFSWERFFTQYLIDTTKNSYLAYSKHRLNPVYLHDVNRKAILNTIKHISI